MIASRCFGHIAGHVEKMDFDDDAELMEGLMRILGELRSEKTLRTDAYKMDEVGDWEAWASQIDLRIKGISMEGSCNYFRYCRRADLGMPLLDHSHTATDELSIAVEDFADDIPRSADDVMCVVKEFCSSKQALREHVGKYTQFKCFYSFCNVARVCFATRRGAASACCLSS